MPRTSGRLQNKALKHPIKEEVAEGTSSEDDADGDKTPDRLYEVVLKRELNIKEEIEDPQETGQEADEFSGYEYLLDQITVSSQHVKTELNESSEENDDEDQDSDVADEDDAADDDDEDEEDEDEEDEDEEDDDEDVDDPDYDTKSTRRKTQNDSSEFSCFYCDFTCKLKSDFGAHLKSHKDLTVHKCGLCKATFDKMKALEIHRLAKHPTDNINKHVCKCCQKKFATKKKLHRHIQNVHKDEKAYKCKHCPKKFARKGGLDQHMSFHQDLRPFECKVCHGKFRTKANKDLHMKAHFGIKEYKCDECGKEFLRKDELKKHLISVHENKFTYSCSICNKSIKGHVLSHLRIHMKEKNHKCKECGKKFVQSSQLKVHMRMHTGVKPFQCEVCKATFAHGISLKTHMFTHTGEKPVKCQLCPAAFTQMPHLRKHMLTIHKSDKPYVCAPCHKFFKAKADLTHHLSEKACAASEKKLKKGAAS